MDELDRGQRNTLRAAMMKAEENKLINQNEAGFIVSLVERFRQDIELKRRKMLTLQGELGQLLANEKIIIAMVENVTAAAERDRARRDSLAKLKGTVSEQPESEDEHTDAEDISDDVSDE